MAATYLTYDDLISLFPGLLEMVGRNLYKFLDSEISTQIYYCVPKLNILNNFSYYLYPNDLDPELMSYTRTILAFTIVDDKMNKGYLHTAPDLRLSDEISAKIFSYGFTNICYFDDGEFKYYDRQAIMRRHIIKNIAEHE